MATIATYEDSVIDLLARRLGSNGSELRIRTRRPEVKDRRQVVEWWLHEKERWGYSEIGRAFGSTHATVINAVRRVNNLLAVGDRMTTAYVNMIRNGKEA